MFRSSGIVAVLGVLACAAVVGAQAMQPERLLMVSEADKPAQKCRVIKCWRDKDGNKVCQVQAIDSGEMMTILEPDSANSGPSGVVRVPTALTKVFRWGSETSTPSIAPSAPPDAVVVGAPKPTGGSSTWDRLFASSRPRVSTQSKVTELPVMDPNKTTVVSARIETPAPKPKKEPESWGTVERISDEDASSAAQKATAKAEATQTTKPDQTPKTTSRLAGLFERKTTVETKVESKPKTDAEPPKAEVKLASETSKQPTKTVALVVDTPDVKKDVEPVEENKVKRLFTRSTEATVTVKTTETKKPELPPRTEPIETKKTDARSTVTTIDAKGDESTWTRLTGLRKPVPGSPSSPPRLSAAAMREAQNGGPGATSWNAAAATPPAPNSPMMSGIAVPTSARNAFTEAGYAPMQPMPMVSEAGVSASLSNAFTNGGTSRPIPSDMGHNYAVPNGLQGGGEMGGAERRPPYVMPPAYAYGYGNGYYPQPMMMPYPPQMMPMPTPASVTQASMIVQVPAPTALQTLRDSALPSERELAVDQLVCCDWKQQPEVVEGLTKAARTDPAPLVRAACVRGLAKMKCNTVPVVSALSAMKTDSDLRVRQAVEQALATLLRP